MIHHPHINQHFQRHQNLKSLNNKNERFDLNGKILSASLSIAYFIVMIESGQE